MSKTMLMAVLVLSCALAAHAQAVLSSVPVGRFADSAQNFESIPEGTTNVHLLAESAGYYWDASTNADDVITSVEYDETTERNCLKFESAIYPADALRRNYLPRPVFEEETTNACVAVDGEDGYQGFYSRFSVKFPIFTDALSPETDEADRLIVWAHRELQSGSELGDLIVTAGRYVGGNRGVELHEYATDSDKINATNWYELVIRAIPGVQPGAQALGFALWIDGKPVRSQAGEEVFDSAFDLSLLTPEARLLIADRRFFPSLTQPGANGSIALGGIAFTGSGSLADLSFTKDAPEEEMEPWRVFSLKWDPGVVGITYRVGSGSAIIVPTAEIGKRMKEIKIPRARTEIAVEATYDTAAGYSQGFWGADGACSLITNSTVAVTNYSFRCDASANLGTGYVRSFRDGVITLGGGGVGAYANFTDAKKQAIDQGKGLVVLNSDFAASRDTSDEGVIRISKGEEITLDLNGHTVSNVVSEHPTIVNCGKLTIIDTVGGGRVVPYAPYAGAATSTNHEQTAVQNYANRKGIPELIIRGGIYEGTVNNSGIVTNAVTGARMEGKLLIAKNTLTDRAEPKFIAADGGEFPFGDKLEDKTLYYAYVEPYWQPDATGVFVWCGKGADASWANAANWRCNAAPSSSGDSVIFPAKRDGVWTAEVKPGDTVGQLTLVGDVRLGGTNDFTAVTWDATAAGRLSGDATLVWSGKLPSDLATLLAADWAGTVEIADVGDASPALLADLASWGTEFSRVRFAGVRGYYHKTVSLALPYALELKDGAKGYAWKNDAGFSGGMVEFPVLAGSGSFVSPANAIANRQVIAFRDVWDYTGTLEVNGKRVVLGPGPAATLEAGSITWSDGLKLKTGSVHNCAVAAFGGTMEATGDYGDVLAKYSTSTVGDAAEVVTLQPSGEFAELSVSDPVGEVKIARWSENAVLVDGLRAVADSLGDVNSQSEISAPLAKAPLLTKLAFANYYTPSISTNGSMVAVRLALNGNAVPVIGSDGDESAALSVADGMASVIVSNVIPGLWYGLEYKASLADEWSEPDGWQRSVDADGGRLELTAPVGGASGFYRVTVTDVEPTGGSEE